MPPKPKITREMIIDAAWDIVRTSGENNLNARNIADRLGCSTQPVLYAFHTMEEIKECVYRKADEYHSEYLMQMNASDPNPSVSIWKNYIRFSVEEKHLFRFLFQSNAFSGSMHGLIDDERLLPVLQAIGAQTRMDMNEVKILFSAIYYPVHGIASLLANNSMDFNEAEYETIIHMIRNGVLKEMEKDRHA